MTRPAFPRTALLLCSLFASVSLQAQETFDKATLADAVSKLAQVVEQRYIFPEQGKAMAADLAARRARGEYDGELAPRQFADLLTAHLQAVSKDKHVRVNCRGKAAAGKKPKMLGGPQPGGTGVGKVEILPGNIGYVEVASFEVRTPEVDKAIADAMTRLADTDALIFDLRGNGGGEPETVALLDSYLFDQPVHLLDIYGRDGKKLEEYRTHATVAGRKYGQRKDVYVLNGAKTFSAGEQFGYDLQSHGRAVIVGATSMGGANPGEMMKFHDNCGVFLPNERVVHAVTKSNWEGTGVKPDVAVDEAQALDRAQVLALTRLRDKATDPQRRAVLERRLAELVPAR